MPEPSPVLEVSELGYRYPGATGPALSDVSLAVGEGELVVLAGRSGSGKTSLLRAACGLIPHLDGGEVSGRVAVGGLSSREHGPGALAGVVGYVAQDPETQVVSTTVRAELELPLTLRGAPEAARARAVEEAALALAIGDLLDRTTQSLSGGELQRVALAAALVGRPPLVLLDEPTSQLDPVAGDELIWLLRRLNQEWGVAAVVSEHRLDRCISAADRVITLDRGRVAFDGDPGSHLEWALAEDPDLATPAARLLGGAGMRPVPVGVKQARAALRAEHGAAVRARGERAPAAAVTRTGAPVIEARGLWARHPGEPPREALRGLDLAIAAGERVALMGRNGAGKSTLLAVLAGLIDPWRGRITAPGGLALLSQSPSDYLVRERVGEELPGAPGRAALRAVGLEWALDRDPRDLSGGERQRLALAIVMAGRGLGGGTPAAVALDEPTRGMDAARKRELGELVSGLSREGTAVIVATHDVEFAADVADRVMLMAEGRLIADGPAGEILAGGWYFSTEVGRILDGAAATVAEGADLIAGWTGGGGKAPR